MSAPFDSLSIAVPGLLGDPAAVATERAVAELRAGRPVVLADGPESWVVLALDTALPTVLGGLRDGGAADSGASTAGLGLQLVLTPARGGALGLAEPLPAQGIALPVAADDSHETLTALAHGAARSLPAGRSWQPAPRVAAEAVQLLRLALLLPAVLLRRVDAPLAAQLQGVQRVERAAVARALAQATRDWSIVARAPVPLHDVGMAQFVVFRGGLSARDQVAIIVGTPDMSGPVPIRLHSACLTGDLFGSLKCDCGDQLRRGLSALQAAGGGVLLYLDQEGRSTGIGAKMRAYALQACGLDTVDADAQLGFGPDERRYEAAVAMLRLLGISSIVLLSNNPAKAAYLSAAGIAVLGREPVLGETNGFNLHYLQTKAQRSGHIIPAEALRISTDPDRWDSADIE